MDQIQQEYKIFRIMHKTIQHTINNIWLGPKCKEMLMEAQIKSYMVTLYATFITG